MNIITIISLIASVLSIISYFRISQIQIRLKNRLPSFNNVEVY